MSVAELPVREATGWSARLQDAPQAEHAPAERWIPVVSGVCLLLVDIVCIVAAFTVAYWVRFVAPDDLAAAFGYQSYLRIGLLVSLITVVLFAGHGLYDEGRTSSWPGRLYAIGSSVSIALVLAVAVSYFVGDQTFSRLWFAAGWAFAVAGLTLWRGLAQTLDIQIRAAVAPLKRVLIVGANPLGQQIGSELTRGFHVVGYVDNGTDLESTDSPLLGPIANLAHLVHTHAVDELIIALPTRRREQVSRIIDRGFARPVTVKFVPALSELLPRRVEVHYVGGRPYIGFAPVARVSWIKRVIDLLLVGGGLVVLSPLLGLISLAIKVDSAGPVLYRQLRVGKDGRTFFMFKFRSMAMDADRRLEELRHLNEASGPLFKIRRDPRITRVGRFLRRWSLDELPQLFNVVRGEMSLVGPRPPLPSEVADYEDWQLGRLRAVPGLTGLWQVSGRSEVPFHDMVRLDLHYIRNWSLGLDLEILLRTVPAVLTNRGAY